MRPRLAILHNIETQEVSHSFGPHYRIDLPGTALRSAPVPSREAANGTMRRSPGCHHGHVTRSISSPEYVFHREPYSSMKSVLSVQSHVVHGYVGGRAATFPLQYLGWDVDNINTVNFSNHTGYGHVEGSKMTKEEMANLFQGLTGINCRYSAVISGYIPSAELVEVVGQSVALLKKENPDLIYICDTVLGDHGHMYVDGQCIEAYRKLLLSKQVDLITPNHYELELICGHKIDSVDSLKKSLNLLHNKYQVKNVVVSSLTESVKFDEEPEPGTLHCAASSAGEGSIQIFKIPQINSYFTGVGDLFTALLLDKFQKNPTNLCKAVNQVLTIMAKVLHLTHVSGMKEYCRHNGIVYDGNTMGQQLVSKINEAESMRFFELRIIEGRFFYDYSEEGEANSFGVQNL